MFGVIAVSIIFRISINIFKYIAMAKMEKSSLLEYFFGLSKPNITLAFKYNDMWRRLQNIPWFRVEIFYIYFLERAFL